MNLSLWADGMKQALATMGDDAKAIIDDPERLLRLQRQIERGSIRTAVAPAEPLACRHLLARFADLRPEVRQILFALLKTAMEPTEAKSAMWEQPAAAPPPTLSGGTVHEVRASVTDTPATCRIASAPRRDWFDRLTDWVSAILSPPRRPGAP